AETELPDWLREAEEPVAEAAAAELPDWLREAEEPVAEAAAAEPELEGILTPQAETELPDWLREAEEPVAETAPVEPELEGMMAPEEKIELPEWDIDSAFPTAVGGIERAGLESKDRFEEEAGVEIPSWLQSAHFAAAEESGAKAEPAADLPDWLTGRQLESLEGPSIFETEGPPGAYESALPDWLMESSPKTPEPGALEPESAELPSWLLETETEFALEGTSGEAEPPADIEAEIELPAWLVEPEETVHVPEAGEEIQEVEMEQFETPEPVLPEEGEAPVEPVETMPEKEKPLEEAFAWLMGLGAQAEVTAAPEAPEAPVEPVEELVETGWQAEEEIASFEAPAEAAFVEEVILVDEPAGEDLPLPEALFVEEEAPVEEPAGEPSLPAFSEALGEELIDQDAAFAWLESLAIKQGASEALLLTPEERSESMPEWVKQDALAAEAALEEPSTEEAEPLEETEAQLSAPEELVEAPALEEAAPAADYGLEFEIEREGIGEEAEPLFEAVEEAEPAFEAVEEAEQFEAAFEPVEEAEPLEAVEEAEIEIETEAVLEPEAPPAEEEIPELPSWLAETAPAPHEEFDWSPPPFPPRSVDLNRASLSDLERIPGVGFIAAQAILNHRDQHGPFQSVDDLALAPEI
ncbi:MAG: helix-hairpin-helix domain-containing protein, partial [Candidatus Omnitrophica bacterium]|nr:helix-hairpin-helix domain-containing protein [Candidatus Omnitrophota bacterium]